MNAITSLNVCFAVMVGFAQNDAGIGRIVALMMPCAIVVLVVWTLLLMFWYQFGIPLGPS